MKDQCCSPWGYAHDHFVHGQASQLARDRVGGAPHESAASKGSFSRAIPGDWLTCQG